MPQAHRDTSRSPGLAAAVRWLLMAAALATLAGCADTRYYWQSVNGHLALMQAARPVEDWLRDPQTPAAMRERLALSQRIRIFAVTELALPDNPSYRRYADLQRRAVSIDFVVKPRTASSVFVYGCGAWFCRRRLNHAIHHLVCSAIKGPEGIVSEFMRQY